MAAQAKPSKRVFVPVAKTYKDPVASADRIVGGIRRPTGRTRVHPSSCSTVPFWPSLRARPRTPPRPKRAARAPLVPRTPPRHKKRPCRAAAAAANPPNRRAAPRRRRAGRGRPSLRRSLAPRCSACRTPCTPSGSRTLSPASCTPSPPGTSRAPSAAPRPTSAGTPKRRRRAAPAPATRRRARSGARVWLSRRSRQGSPEGLNQSALAHF